METFYGLHVRSTRDCTESQEPMSSILTGADFVRSQPMFFKTFGIVDFMIPDVRVGHLLSVIFKNLNLKARLSDILWGKVCKFDLFCIQNISSPFLKLVSRKI